MLAIRMQRTGRKGHAQFRIVVQDSRVTPSSGQVVALLGHYDPHSKQLELVKEKAHFYLEHGAQPSPRVSKLLKAEGLKLPAWVAKPLKKKSVTRHSDKLRKNRPAGTPAPAKPAAEEATEQPPEDKPAETQPEPQQPAEPVAETPAVNDEDKPHSEEETTDAQ